jgi:DNA-binding transcriptional ArsR family regulator
MSESTGLAVNVLRRVHQAASLLGHPLRLKVMENLAEPDSASGLARRFGVPRQVLNYHLRALEAAGLVQFVAERPRGGLKERVVQRTAHAYLISPEVLGAIEPDPGKLRDRFSWAYLVAAAAKIVRDLATFTIETEVRFASASDRDAFTRELSSKIAELAVRYHDAHAPHGRLFRFLLGAYPAITKIEEEGEDSPAALPAQEHKP